MVGVEVCVALSVGDGDDGRVAGLDLFYVADRLAGTFAVAEDDREHGRVSLDQRERAVFEFAGGEPLGVLVAYLFQLQRPLQGDGKLQATPDKEVRRGVAVRLGNCRGDRAVEHRLHVAGQITECRQNRPAAPDILDSCKCEQVQCRELTGEGLCRGDTDFGPGPDEQGVVTLAVGGRTDGVRDRECLCTPPGGLPECTQGVCRLAALGHPDHQVRTERWRRGGVLARQKRLCRNPGPPEQFGPVQRGVVRGAGGDELDRGRGCQVQVEVGRTAEFVDPAAETLP